MENTITQQITTDELQKLFGSGETWTGYLWQDDKSEPFVFLQDANNEKCKIDFTTKIPFIIEGFLVGHPKKDNKSEVEPKPKQISLTIKNIDGVYYCYKSENFKTLQNIETFPAVEVLKNKGIEALQFIPIFKKQNDPFSGKFPKENSEKSKDSERFQEYVYSHQIFKGILS